MVEKSHPISRQKITSVAHQIAKKFNPLRIVLFGSYATGNYHAYSDVDLLVVGELSRIRSRRDEFYDEAERAMRNVSCSVLIVKDEDKVWEMYQSLK